jgi:pyrroline-5-carboxylate reductase
MIGSGKMVLKNADKSLDDLINAVCSKGGTTIEAVNTYNQNNLSEITDKAIDACIKRASELENL